MPRRRPEKPPYVPTLGAIWRLDGLTYVHTPSNICFANTTDVEKFQKEFLDREIISPKIVEPTLFNDVTNAPCKAPFQRQGVDFSRDIRVPVKNTCFIQETKFIRVVCRNEGEMPQQGVIEQTEGILESEAETEAVRSRSRAGPSNAGEGTSNAGEETSRAAVREARRRRPKPRADETEPSWVRKILDAITCVRDDIRHLTD
ncbi:unnamed protein product [Cuscuta campestris]|uniref:Uncharacterized protein n=1 Tax=Cuscuta campestris TaxID=132261 RepID=A0A484LMI7_9ASTE|nr:unnamed protein product [Cuscuta campestris]